MPVKMRATLEPTGDRVAELRTATNLRKVLRSLSSVERNADNILQGIHRDEDGRAYLEFVTASPVDVCRIIEEGEFAGKFALAESTTEPGEECVKCGNVSGPTLPTVCPRTAEPSLDMFATYATIPSLVPVCTA